MEISKLLEKHKLTIQDIEKNIEEKTEITICSKGLKVRKYKENYTEQYTFPIFDIETDNYMAQVE